MAALFSTILPTRAAIRGVINPGVRQFSTSRILRSELSYQVFGPEQGQETRKPIVFLHGLFGSKMNNRSISRFVLAGAAGSTSEFILSFG